MLRIFFVRCNRNEDKTSGSNSSGTISKTSDIGVGTEGIANNTQLNDSMQYLSINNDAMTVISSISEPSISVLESDSSIYHNKDNYLSSNPRNAGGATQDIENDTNYESEARHRPSKSSSEMQSKVGCDLNKTTYPPSSDDLNVSLQELHDFQSSERKTATSFSEATKTSKAEDSKPFDIENLNLNHDHNNVSFILEENQ